MINWNNLVDVVEESETQCPISNHCPMEDARQCERYGQCYWEEQDQTDLDEQSHNYEGVW